MHFAINRVEQAPLSDINEFEDQQIEYAKQLQDSGTQYTYDIFQHQLMQRAHIDPELFHLRDKQKRDIYRRIISHLKTELEFKRAEFDTIKHKDEVAAYALAKQGLIETSEELKHLKTELENVGDQIIVANKSAANMKAMTLEKLRQMAEKLAKASAYLLSAYTIPSPEIHKMVERRIAILNHVNGEFGRLLKAKVDRKELSAANLKPLAEMLTSIDTETLTKTIPITPQKSQGSTLASQAITHAAEADEDDADDAAMRQQAENLKKQKKAADKAAEQEVLKSLFK